MAWQGIKELKWNGKSWLLERFESPLAEDGDLRASLESLDSEGNRSRRWILFSRNYQGLLTIRELRVSERGL
jgi:hypothetical protein